MERRAAFRVVDDFEQALCEFTGAPYAVTVDSCTNALFLSLLWCDKGEPKGIVYLPKHTYVGVAQAVVNAGWGLEFRDEKWAGSYQLDPLPIIDSAKRFERGMWFGAYGGAPKDFMQCVSFQAGKLLPIGRGGAILHDNAEADEWFRRARLDGRTAGADYQDAIFQEPGFHCYMTPPDAARGLWLLTYLEDDDKGDWSEYPDISAASWV